MHGDMPVTQPPWTCLSPPAGTDKTVRMVYLWQLELQGADSPAPGCWLTNAVQLIEGELLSGPSAAEQ